MSEVLVDRELLERIVNTNMADYAVIAYQRKEIRFILEAQPAEAEGVDFGFDDRSVRVSQEAYSIFLARERHHLAALSAVTAERDRLLAELERAYANYNQVSYASTERGKQIDQLRAEVEALRLDATLGSAIQRACRDLPEGFMVSVSLEKDAGTLELCLPDTDAVLDDFDGETFADQIHAAIDAAMAAKEAEPEHVCSGCGAKGWTGNCLECIPY